MGDPYRFDGIEQPDVQFEVSASARMAIVSDLVVERDLGTGK